MKQHRVEVNQNGERCKGGSFSQRRVLQSVVPALMHFVTSCCPSSSLGDYLRRLVQLFPLEKARRPEQTHAIAATPKQTTSTHKGLSPQDLLSVQACTASSGRWRGSRHSPGRAREHRAVLPPLFGGRCDCWHMTTTSVPAGEEKKKNNKDKGRTPLSSATALP